MFSEKLLNLIFPFLTWLPEVNRHTLKSDLVAGITGAFVVLPQGVAFAIIAGLPPVYGLYTAMVTPIIAGLFGSSRHLVSGPTTAISIVVFASISQFAQPGSSDFVRLALVVTFLAGAFQLFLGLARMGVFINFVSHVVVIGFTAGASILIVSSQMRQVLGIFIPAGSTFADTWGRIFRNFGSINYYVLGVAVFTLLVAILTKKYLPRWPNLLTAMILGSVVAWLLGDESRGITLVGQLPGGFPPFSVPDLTFANIQTLSASAFAIALLGLMEAVAIARAIGTKTGQNIDANQEFIGQGLSNIVGSFFSSYAGSGSFTRSGINYEAGAQTPISAISAAVLLLIIVLLIAPLTAHLPYAVMGGIILLVAYNLVDWHHIHIVYKASKRQSIVLFTTFFATLFFNLEFAIILGVLTSLFFYLQRTSQPNVAVLSPDPEDLRRRFVNLAWHTDRADILKECPQLKIIRIDGSIFFGAINHINTEISNYTVTGEKYLLLVCGGVNFLDVAGAEWLVQLTKKYRKEGGDVFISGLKLVAQDTLVKGGYKVEIGHQNFFKKKAEAVPVLYARLDRDVCMNCTARIFRECKDSLNQ